MVIEYGSDREVELCRVSHNPDAVVKGLEAKTLMVMAAANAKRRSRTCKYTSIRIVDHEAMAAA